MPPVIETGVGERFISVQSRKNIRYGSVCSSISYSFSLVMSILCRLSHTTSPSVIKEIRKPSTPNTPLTMSILVPCLS